MKRALFVGRFQPFHLGHLSVIEAIRSGGLFPIIGIGSSQKSYEYDNPFSFEERKDMIKNSVQGEFEIVRIPDTEDDEKWVKMAEKVSGNFDYLYSGNNHVINPFVSYGAKQYIIVEPKKVVNISSSEIREMIAKGKEWEKYVPRGTMEVIHKVKGDERIRRLYAKVFKDVF